MPRRQNGSFRKTIHNERCLICTFIVMQIKVIFHTGVRNVLHGVSFWNRGKRNIANGLCCLVCRSLWLVHLSLSVHLASFFTPQSRRLREFFVGLKFFPLLSFFRVGEVACSQAVLNFTRFVRLSLCEEELSQAFTIQKDLRYFLESSSFINTLSNA